MASVASHTVRLAFLSAVSHNRSVSFSPLRLSLNLRFRSITTTCFKLCKCFNKTNLVYLPGYFVRLFGFEKIFIHPADDFCRLVLSSKTCPDVYAPSASEGSPSEIMFLPLYKKQNAFVGKHGWRPALYDIAIKFALTGGYCNL